MPRRPTRPHIPDFRALSRQVRDVAREALFEGLREYAEEQRDEFVEAIELQAFPSFQEIFYPESETNLSPGWLARKERAGADLRTMIATSWYKDHIQVFTRKARHKGEPSVIRVGFHPQVKARDLHGRVEDITLNLVAIYNEHGSLDGRLPARPHWRPHFQRMHARARKTRERMVAEIREKLRASRRLRGKVVVR